MFKLLKDLTRAPEPLNPDSQEHTSPARKRSRSVSITAATVSQQVTRTRSRSGSAASQQQPIEEDLQLVSDCESEEEVAEEDGDVTETETDARHVRYLVLGMDEVEHTMALVEVSVELAMGLTLDLLPTPLCARDVREPASLSPAGRLRQARARARQLGVEAPPRLHQ